MINLFLTSTRLFLIVSKHLVASYYDGRKVSSRELADIYNINNRALIPVLNRLTRTGYMYSQVGGLNPGHIFSKDPKEIRVGEIIIALEGEMDMMGCDSILGDGVAGCTSENRCKFCRIIANFIELGRKKIHSISLYDLYIDSKQMQN